MSRIVLIVDDSLAMRRMVSFTLESHGYQVFQGSNGVEGLELFDSHSADLIIADLNMPEMDGITFLKQVRARPAGQGIPILMLTTENMNSRVKEGREAGATGWMVKPFKPERLIEIVARVLR